MGMPKLLIMPSGPDSSLGEPERSRLQALFEKHFADGDHQPIILQDHFLIYQLINGKWEPLPPAPVPVDDAPILDS